MSMEIAERMTNLANEAQTAQLATQATHCATTSTPPTSATGQGPSSNPQATIATPGQTAESSQGEASSSHQMPLAPPATQGYYQQSLEQEYAPQQYSPQQYHQMQYPPDWARYPSQQYSPRNYQYVPPPPLPHPHPSWPTTSPSRQANNAVNPNQTANQQRNASQLPIALIDATGGDLVPKFTEAMEVGHNLPPIPPAFSTWSLEAGIWT
jgi:hypothetical protein